MSDLKQRWINAAIVLGKDPGTEILCPECEKGILRVKDEPVPEGKKIDRYLVCDICGKWNVLTKNEPGN